MVYLGVLLSVELCRARAITVAVAGSPFVRARECNCLAHSPAPCSSTTGHRMPCGHAAQNKPYCCASRVLQMAATSASCGSGLRVVKSPRPFETCPCNRSPKRMHARTRVHRHTGTLARTLTHTLTRTRTHILQRTHTHSTDLRPLSPWVVGLDPAGPQLPLQVVVVGV